MLSIGRLVCGAERYYLRSVASGREEYYTGSGEAPGEWVGNGIARLGLSGAVEATALSMVLAGLSPEGELLSSRRLDPKRRVAGLDLTFSAPKSVSLLYAFCGEEVAATVREQHARAVRDALGYLERRALKVRRGAGGSERLSAEGLVAAAFVHRTSRAGDPQLHTHVLVANVAFGADGRWSAPYARLLYHHARTAGFLYQASLRARLTDALGVRFGEVTNGMAELDGIRRSVLRGFSTRRVEIETQLANLGASSAAAAEVAALATRSPKLTTPAGDGEGLRERWRARAVELGMDLAALAGLLGGHRRTPLEEARSRQLAAHLVSDEGLTATESTFERRDAVRGVAGLLQDGATAEEVEAIADLVFDGAAVVELATEGRGGERRHTTEELLALIAGAIGRAGDAVAVVTEALVSAALAAAGHLAPEQQAMVRRLVTSGAGVDIVVGKAGSGKTAALAAARSAWELAGLRVVGTALSARAAKGLSDGAGIESVTIAGLSKALDTGSLRLARDVVLVVDEAGMVGTRTTARLLDAAERAGAKVVLVGDPRQLAELEAGGVFGALARRLGAVELAENRRQAEVWEREALDELREGHPLRALAAFVGAGRVVTAPDMKRAREALVERWRAAVTRGEDVLALAATRRDVDALNLTARVALKDAGRLEDDLAIFGELALASGDIVVCLRNDRGIGVLNGTRGTVVEAGPTGVVVSTEDGPRVLPARYAVAHLAYGYALTVHKAQGATVDRAFVLASESLTREAGYVALSRARHGTELFVPAAFEDTSDCEGHGPTDTDVLDRVGRRLSVSSAKHLALDELDHGPDAPLRRDERNRVDAACLLHESEPALGAPDDARDPVVALTAISTQERAPDYLLSSMGSPPAFARERAEYDRVARLVAAYRDRYRVEDDDVLGERPLEAVQRSAYEAVRRELAAYGRRLGRNREGPDLDPGIVR